MASFTSPFAPDFDSAFDPPTTKDQASRDRRYGSLLGPPAFERPDTPIRGRQRSRTTNALPERTSWEAPIKSSRTVIKCNDCSGDDLCPLHDFISEEPDVGTLSDSERLPRKSTLVSQRRKQRPKLRLKTPGKVQQREFKASGTVSSRHISLGQSDTRRNATRDSQEEDLPSGSTLLGSGSTPGSGSAKKWGKQRVSFAVEPLDTSRPNSREPLRPHLQRNTSSQSAFSSTSTSTSSGEKKKSRRPIRRLFSYQKYPSSSGDSPQSGATDYMARRDTYIQTPVSLPRRLSRLPSFFTRERLILPERIQGRDLMLLISSLIMIVIFTAVGVLAAVRPDRVCQVPWLAVSIDSFLPNLAISTPYTYMVVGFAVSRPGRRWINGRYTPLLYATCAALGRVAVGALSGNITWKVFRCAWGGA